MAPSLTMTTPADLVNQDPTHSSNIIGTVMPASNLDELIRSDDPNHPANLIPELCRLFYTLGWVTGTG